MAWCFEDELTEEARRLFSRLTDESAIVPSVWPLEIANALLVAERRQRQTPSKTERYVELVLGLPIFVDHGSVSNALNETRRLAQQGNLSAYDASYLELAVRRGLPLATLDARLRQAATSLGVSLL